MFGWSSSGTAGPAGAKGDKGDKGDQGDPGPSGSANPEIFEWGYYGGSIGFSQELYLGPVNNDIGTYNYSAVLKTTPLSKAHTLTKVWVKLATPLAADATIRVRNDSGTELYAGVLVAGQTELISGVLAIVTTNMKLLFSIDPGVVTLTLEEARFGWTRKLS